MLAMGLDLKSNNLDHQKVAMGMDLAMGLVKDWINRIKCEI